MAQKTLKSLNLHMVKNPFVVEHDKVITIECNNGDTLLDLRRRYFPSYMQCVVARNGQIIPNDKLHLYYPVTGDYIIIAPEIFGGGNNENKQILGNVLMLAIAIAAPPSAMWMLGVGKMTLGASLLAGGMMVGGGLLVNSLLSTPRPNIPTISKVDFNTSNVYSWNPQLTQQAGIPIQRVYGTHKIKSGNVIGSYLENDGEKQYLNALISLGIGPISRLYDFKINDQPKDNLKGVVVHERRGYVDQDVIENFNNTKKELPLSVKVVQGSPYTYLTPDSDFDEMEIDITFPQGLWHMKDDGNLEEYQVDLGIEVRKQGESSWESLTGSIKEATYTLYNGKWSAGKWMNSYFFKPDAIVPSYAQGSDWVEVATGSTNSSDHYEGERYGDKGSPYYWRWIGSMTEHVATIMNSYVTIKENKSSAIRKTFFARNLPRGKYEIRVSNLTPDKTTSRYGDDMYLTAVREVYYDDFEYPRHVLCGIKALATDQLSGSLRFSCMCEGSLVRVYNGSSWSVSYSENPAWVAWDILTKPIFDNNLNVISYRGFDPSRLILNEFFELANYCDELVPDGRGGQEKRCTFNGVFDASINTWYAVLQVLQLARAVPTWNGINIGCVIDKKIGTSELDGITQVFGMGNIIKGSFKESFSSVQERAAILQADFIDAENDYERDTVTRSNLNIKSNNTMRIPLFGADKKSQIWRELEFRLAKNECLTNTCRIDVGIEAIRATIGDKVGIAHEVPKWGVGSGRIISATINSITIDRDVVIELGKSYIVIIQLQDDSVVVKNIANAAGTYSTLQVSDPFTAIPQQYCNYSLGETTKYIKPFKLTRIDPIEDFKSRSLTLIEYNGSVYDKDYNLPSVPTPNYSSLETLPPVTDIVLDELLIKRQDGTIDDVIDVYFKRPSGGMFSYAEVWYNNGAGWKHAGDTNIEYLRITGVEINKSYSIAVVTVNLLGTKQSIQNAAKAEIYTYGKFDPPSQVTNFTAKQNGQFINFNWTHISDADLWGYEIRQGASWEGARVIATGISHNNFTWQAELNGTYKFLIKSIDDSNLYSNTATSVDVTLKGINENINIIKSQDEITKTGGPDGAKTNFVFVGSQSGEPSKYLIMPHMLTDTDVPNRTDLDAELTNYKGDITLNAEYVTNPIDILKSGLTWVRILNIVEAFDPGATDMSYPNRLDTDYPADTDTHITMPSEIKLYLCYSNDNITYTSWEEYKGTVQKEFRYIKIKITANIVSQTGVLKLQNLLISLDVPDVDFVIKDFSVGATGSDILFSTYQKQLYDSFTVRASVLDSVVNKVPVISKNNGLDGFNIKLRDKTDALVSGTVDIQVTGY